MTRRAPRTAVTGRPRQHPSIAPAHLGERASIALLAVGIGGTAVAITGVSMIVMGLTMGARYAADPPPGIASLGLAPALGGGGLVLLGVALVAGAVAVLGEVRGARVATGALAALTAVGAAAGTIVVATGVPRDVVLAVALTIAAAVFGVAAVLLFRRH